MARNLAYMLLLIGCFLPAGLRARAAAQLHERPARTRIVVRDKLSREPLPGAAVAIRSGADTLRGTATRSSDRSGVYARYACDRIFRDSVWLEVDFLGYAPFRKRYAAGEFIGSVYAEMEADSLSIAQVTIVGKRVAMIFRGDTTVYDAAAFRTMADDRLAELLRQLPGVEIRDDKIYAGGEEVRRVYVDGRDLFGRQTSASLTDLGAADVRSVRIYEELSPEDRRTGNLTARKQKVMDVETKSGRSILWGGQAAATTGTSIEKDYSGARELRRSERLRLFRHSERGSFTLEGTDARNESGRDDPSTGGFTTPSERTRAELSHEYRRGDSTSVWTTIALNRERETSVRSSRTEYFPTQAYAHRSEEQQSQSLAGIFSVDANNMVAIQRRHGTLSTALSASYRHGTSEGVTGTLQRLDDRQTRTRQHGDVDNRSVGFDLSVGYSMRLSERSRLAVGIGGSYYRSDDDAWQTDTVASLPGLRMLLHNDGRGRRLSGNASVDYRCKLGERSALSASYRLTTNRNRARRMSVDHLDDPQGKTDSVNSYDYTVDYRTHEFSLRWNRSSEQFHCYVDLRGLLHELSRDERFPEAERTPHRFFALAPSLNIACGKPRRRLSASLYASPQVPSAEALRHRLDATDPLALRTGNPDLRLPVDFSGSLHLQLDDARTARTFSVGIRGNYTTDYIASRTTLFLDPTYLAQWDYTAQAGARLTTEANVGGRYDVGADAAYSQQIAALRSTLRISTRYGFSRTPYFLGEELCHSGLHSLGLGLGFDTGFSSKVRIALATDTSLGSYSTREQTRRTLQQRINARLDLQPGKYFGRANLSYDFYCNDASKSLTRHYLILNVAAGRRFGRRERFSLSLGAADLLNRPDHTSTSFQTDYLLASTTSYLGRYLYLHAAHTF